MTTDDPLYSGRALYWLHEPVLGLSLFKAIAMKARDVLEERYTPELHIDLPIAKTFEALSSDPKWWEYLKRKKGKLIDQNNRFFRKFLGEDFEFLDKENTEVLENICIDLIGIVSQSIKQKKKIEVEKGKSLLGKIEAYKTRIIKENKKDHIYDNRYRNEFSIFNSFFTEYLGFSNFLGSKLVKAAETGAALLYGEAGIGKSHLLCDLSLYRINQNLPTVFLLGQHYEGGNPLKTLKSTLDLSSYTNKEVLGALDAAGESYKTKTLIVIDAINEGFHRDDWQNHIRAFLTELSQYPNISVLLSCRTSYLKYMLPDSVDESCLIQIQHLGFQGYEHRAAEKYMSKQGISKPSAPILAPEFTNPLFLKTCCKTLKENGMSSFPKGMHGLTQIFDYYLQSVEKTVSRRKKYNFSEQVIKSALKDFASQLFPSNFSGFPITIARNLVNSHDPNINIGDSLFNELLHEGILSEDVSYTKEGKNDLVIRFTYERFSDHYIAEQIIEQYNESTINNIFLENEPLGKAMLDEGIYRYQGVFEAQAIVIAEKFGLELIDLLPQEHAIDSRVLERIFIETIIWRSSNSFTDRTLEVLNGLNGYGYHSPVIETLLKLSTEPNHPWNADLLHKNLIDLSMAERDHFWSIDIALGDQFEVEGVAESIVRTLIEWSCYGEIEDIEKERARLCAITLFWFLTTSNRKVRDQATKSLVRLLSVHPELLPELLNKFHAVNDLYLVERLYAVTYGVVCNIDIKSLISKIAGIVYELVFKDGKPIPHILLRDYARGVLEYALHLNLLPYAIAPDHFRPPYKSVWPIKSPSKEDIEKMDGDEFSSHIKSSLIGFPGDFGNYTMSCIHYWSPTSLSEPAPKIGYEYKKEFAANPG